VEQILQLDASGEAKERQRHAAARAWCGAMTGTKDDADHLVEQHALVVKKAKQILRLYREMLRDISWRSFSPRVRDALKADFSGSVREYDRLIKHAETSMLRILVDEAKARMRKNGERPKGGIDDAALDEVAEQQGLPSGDALKKQLQRYKSGDALKKQLQRYK
jgi:hypothetical protein